MKIFVLHGLSSVIIFASSAYAEERVNFNIAHSMNALITFQHCKVNSKIKDDKIVVLTSTVTVAEDRADNLSKQNTLLAEDYLIKETEAVEWKAEYMQCTAALIDAKKVPWYSFNLKSVLTGSIGTLLLILL